jgi:hypothetical protein
MAINQKYSYNGSLLLGRAEEIRVVYRKYDLLAEARINLFKTGKKSEEDKKILRKDLSELRIACNAEETKLRTFKRQSFRDIDPIEFNNSEIIGACFHQDVPFTDVFPPNIEGVVFTKCNLDNCNIPPGATVNGGTNKHFKVMNDQEYWLVDKDLKPIEPRDKERFIECGLSIEPKDIPAEPLIEAITVTHDPKRIEREKINALANNTGRLRDILIEKGEL